MSYRHLIEHLPGDIPIYGLRAPRFDGRTHLCPTLGDLARLFLKDVRRFHPEPPYLFAGYCFGGVVAHEMAAQLEAQGQSSRFLGAIESAPYGRNLRSGHPPDRRGLRQRARGVLIRLWRSHGMAKVSFTINYLFGTWGRVRRSPRQLAYRTVCRTGWKWPGYIWNLNLVALREARLRYVTPDSQVHVTLFYPDQPAAARRSNQWQTVAGGGVDAHAVTAPGIGHVSIMQEPYVAQLAVMFGERIEAALQTTS